MFPISLKIQEQAETERVAIAMLDNCVNCEELVWTRKGALTDQYAPLRLRLSKHDRKSADTPATPHCRVWQAIHRMNQLHTLELNAHTNLSPGSWSADNLLPLPPLRSLSLILPDRNVAEMLGPFFKHQIHPGGALALEEFSVLCRESPVINNRTLRAISPFLAGSRLTSLALAGCAKLTGDPLLELLPTLPHLRHLALEACNLDPSFYQRLADSPPRLQSLKLTHPGPRHATLPAFFPALEKLLAALPDLKAFTLYHSGASSDGRREWPVLPVDFLNQFAAANGSEIRKFEVSGILTSVEGIEILTRGSPRLRNLVLHLGSEFDLVSECAAVAESHTLL